MKRKMNRVVLLSLIILVSCSQLTAKKTSIWMNSMYNAQYNEYLTWFEKDSEGNWKTKDSVSEEQKNILRMKKRIFTELYPLIEAYAIYASTSQSPKGFDMSLVEDRIVELINRLVTLSIEKKSKEAEGNVGPSASLDNYSRNSESSNSVGPDVRYE